MIGLKGVPDFELKEMLSPKNPHHTKNLREFTTCDNVSS